MIMVSAADMFNSTRVLESQLRTNTANNDINAVKQMGLIPEGVLVNPYLGVETTQARGTCGRRVQKRKGSVSIWRRDPELERDNDFDTENAKAKTTARFVPSKWRLAGMVGKPRRLRAIWGGKTRRRAFPPLGS